MPRVDRLLSRQRGVVRKGVPRLVVGLTVTSALISALWLAMPWSIVVAVLSAAAALLTWVDLKVRDQQTAEHDFLLSQTPEGELAILGEGHAAARELDAIVQPTSRNFPKRLRSAVATAIGVLRTLRIACVSHPNTFVRHTQSMIRESLDCFDIEPPGWPRGFFRRDQRGANPADSCGPAIRRGRDSNPRESLRPLLA